jgi:thioesterase domain-containing protein
MSENISQLLSELAATWHGTIPVSDFMGIVPTEYLNGELRVTAPLPPNINLHGTMFAGSIYTLMTLTGWGAVWLHQRLAGVEGGIVLADAHIRYLAPVTCIPIATVTWPETDLSPLAKGRKVRVKLEVVLRCGDNLCAQFSALYVSLAKAASGLAGPG